MRFSILQSQGKYQSKSNYTRQGCHGLLQGITLIEQ